MSDTVPSAPRVFLAPQRFVMLGLLVVSVGLNFVLSLQLKRARNALQPPPFLSGHRAPVLKLSSDTGKEVVLDYGKGSLPTVLYWLSPSCGWCDINFANFEALASQAPGRYRFLAISVASPGQLAKYRERHKTSVPLYTINARSAGLYRFAGTPGSLLVSGEGDFIKRWIGAYTPDMLDDIEKTLSVQLPGLSPATGGVQGR